MKERIGCVVGWPNLLRPVLWATSLVALLLTFGCASDSHQMGGTTNYPSGISEDIDQQLKYDARVESFDTSGEHLIVNVNDGWLSSPPGMQERSVGQWYSMWHSNHGGGVIVQHDGNKIAGWTSDGGFKPETKAKGGESHSEG
jgi:hypothetical protein